MPYSSITSQGGLLPLDLLDRIGSGRVSGQSAKDFDLSGTSRLSDRIQAAFSDALTYWEAYRRRLERSSESVTSITRQTWIVPLLELLGFDALTFQREAIAVGGDNFVISHRQGSFADATPIHVVGNDRALDRRGSARRSPHSAVQEYLNRSDAVWGIVTNGERLRLLRSTARTAVSTYIEFDLNSIFDGNQYSEFVLLYRLLHASRFPFAEGTWQDTILEHYFEQGIDEGDRVRERLRDGVEAALKILGTGLLEHPDSEQLRLEIGSGRLSADEYYQQLLRLVYRLLFLMVAEERKLIAVPDVASDEKRKIYARYYSVGALRERADRYFAEDRDADLWQSLGRTFRLFSDGSAARLLGVAALGGQLFGFDSCRSLEQASCSNRRLLSALRRLSTFEVDGIRRRVNYAGLDVEELGSVYESLLDFEPDLKLVSATFDLVSGDRRRSTGSYYTPPELVEELIENTIAPVMNDRMARAGDDASAQEARLLSLRIIDPASGSGHFLLAAARRVGRQLAMIRSREDDPAPEEYRHAVRDVIRECIYAIDKNPLAVDLCKVSLWLESHDPTRPLTFLDHHVMCGDSLVGLSDLSALSKGIPNSAYEPVTGDDRSYARQRRDVNRRERDGQRGFDEGDIGSLETQMASDFAILAELDEQTVVDVEAKSALFTSLLDRQDRWDLKLACDVWTFAFFAPQVPPKDTSAFHSPTTSDVRAAFSTAESIRGDLAGGAVADATRVRYLHWPVDFSNILSGGRFDCILGNPPFLTGKKISAVLGSSYRKYLAANYSPAHNTTDLCAYFFRRSFQFLRTGGRMGLIATNTISQGDTRQSGLQPIIADGGAIKYARRFIRWPGSASVEVNLIVVATGKQDDPAYLDGQRVESISSKLDDLPEYEAKSLQVATHGAFVGDFLRGIGFVVEAEDAETLLRKDPRNRESLKPYLAGQDLNSRVGQTPARYAICFEDWSYERASSYPDLMQIVKKHVWPERQKVNQKLHKDNWWLYGSFKHDLRRSLEDLTFTLVRSRVSELHMIARVPTDQIFSDGVMVFPFDDYYHFALLQSVIHETWVRRQSSTLESRNRYTPTDSFETFAFPTEPDTSLVSVADIIGKRYESRRALAMSERHLGLNGTSNLINDPDCTDDDIIQMRELCGEMNRAILACYHWDDLDFEYGFHKNERGQVRYTVSDGTRNEIIRRLLDMNLEITSREA